MLFLFIIQKNQFFGHLHNDATVFLLIFTSVLLILRRFPKGYLRKADFFAKNEPANGSYAYIRTKFRRKYDA